MKIAKIGKPALWRALAAVFAVILVLSVGGTAVTTEWSGYINAVLGVSGTKIVTNPDSTEDPLHYKSNYTDKNDVLKNALDVAKQIQAEGTVLMTNKNNALPLNKGAKVTFLGYNAAEIAMGGSGSGAGNAGERAVTLEKACADNGVTKLEMNTVLQNFYKQNYADKVGFTQSQGWGGVTWNFRNKDKATEINASQFTADIKSSFENYKDAGIFIMTRIGGEGSDLNHSTKYLALSDDEKSVLQQLKDGPFSKRIVILNTLNTPEIGWLDDYNIDACLHIGAPGEVGMDAVTDILVGNTVPSGKLGDTYAVDSLSAPAMQNFGDFTFTNASEINNAASQKYLMYNEGIYIGYRYYETRYEDVVLGRGNAASEAGTFASAGNWNYAEEVAFPFGYGLSYADFTQTLEDVDVDWANRKATVKVNVKNNSTAYTGKDVVEVYVQAPYTAGGGLEKSAVQLAGFAKTNPIAPGKSEPVSVTIDLNDVASYDYKINKTYIMDDGTYYFTIGNGAHEAINNILTAKGLTDAQKARMVGEGNADKVRSSTKTGFNKDEYMLSATKRKVTNQFEQTDVNHYLDDANEIKYLSRDDWNGTWPKNMTGFAATAAMVAEANSYYTTADAKAPAAYTKGDSDTSSFVAGAKTEYSLAMMIGVEYDDANWDLLLDQLTVAEMLQLSRQGRTGAESVNLPETTAVDGPAGYGSKKYVEDYTVVGADAVRSNVNVCFYPAEVVVADTWNVPLARKMGEAVGEEGLWGGGVGWYGPAANIHRTPYSGRNFEYYSEDGFISGELSEAVCQGAMSKGIIVYLKHFFLNDQETNRIGVCTFSNEQALREIYLRAFQAAFETTGSDDRAANGCMGAFNRLGMVWSGHHSNLWKNVLEGEWGFTGNITTDFGQNPTGLMEPQLAYEAGTTMFCTSQTAFVNYLESLVPFDAKLYANLREATRRTLYNFANSAAMNGLTSDSKVVKVKTWYEIVLLTMTIVSAVVVAGSGAMVGIQAFAKKEEN